ncbi:hypothetical protein [Streptosporangium saharense]|uniref:hypothetical protein n=1 Tax=Streptosporangium saharense TaxID=1706840 RepID=UPI00331FA9E2
MPVRETRNWDLDLESELIERAVEVTDVRIPARYQSAVASERPVRDGVNALVAATATVPGSQLGRGPPLLLLDDLGSAKASEWTEEITYRVINHRHENLLPGVFTSNLLLPT